MGNLGKAVSGELYAANRNFHQDFMGAEGQLKDSQAAVAKMMGATEQQYNQARAGAGARLYCEWTKQRIPERNEGHALFCGLCFASGVSCPYYRVHEPHGACCVPGF